MASRLPPTLLLLSADEMLADLVHGVVKPPWQIAERDARALDIRLVAQHPMRPPLAPANREIGHPIRDMAHPHPEKSEPPRFSPRPNVRLVIVDDQAIEEYDLNKLLAEICKQFSSAPILYVADRQSDDNERRARSSGAHYYISKPIPPERFTQVLTSFLRAEQTKG